MKTANERLRSAVGGDREMDEIRYLVEEEGADPTAPSYRDSALQIACKRKYIEAVRYFVEERNVDVKARDSWRQTLLHLCCDIPGSSFEIVELLVGTGSIDIEARDKLFGQTALHFACRFRPARVAIYLVEQGGANVDAMDERGRNGLRHVFEKIDWAISPGEPPDGFPATPSFEYEYRAEILAGRLDLARFLIPRTRMGFDTFHHPAVWEGGRSIVISWDVKELLVTAYATQNLHGISNEYCQQFPLHTFFRVPLPSEDNFLEVVHHYRNHTSSRSFDSDGRLPIHLALEARSPFGKIIVTPRVIFEWLELEPRSAFVRDTKTGFFPFEATAAAAAFCPDHGSYECLHKAEDFLSLIYQLFRCNPGWLLTSRGVGN